MILKTKPNIKYKYSNMSIETFLNFNLGDNMILSPQLLSVTKKDVKFGPFLFVSEFILLIMNLSNSRYVYSNLNLSNNTKKEAKY